MPGDAADLAIAEAMPVVEPSLQRDLLELLLARGTDTGIAQIPELFELLDDAGQMRVISQAGRLFRALRQCIRSPRVQTRQNTIRIIGRSSNTRLAYLATLGVHDGSPLVRVEAAATLLQLAEAHRQLYLDTCAGLSDVAEDDDTVTTAVFNTLQLMREERQFITSAVLEAVQTYESHLRNEVVEAAMLQVDTLEDGVFDAGSNRRGKLTNAMLDIFSRAIEPRFAAFAYIALRQKELRGRVVNAISTCRDNAFFVEFIRHHWLARDPSIARNMQLIRGLAWLGDGSQAAFTLPEDVAASAPAWVAQLGLPAEEKVAVLHRFLLLDHPAANREAVWALIRIQSSASTQALERVAECDDPELRRIARHELAHRRRRAGLTTRRMPTDRPIEWSRLLAQSRLAEEFNEFWNHFERIDPTLGRKGGAHALQLIPGFMTQARVKLAGRAPQDRMRAVRLLTMLGLGEAFRTEVFNLASDPDAEVRAVVMNALGRIGDATCRRILERGLNDEYPLVQVAAINALEEMGAEQRGEQVRGLANAEYASVRAAATRVMLRLRMPEAAANLVYMLNDARTEHRTEALMLTDQMQLYTLIPRVADMADRDQDPRVARLARQVARKLERVVPARNTGGGEADPSTEGKA